MMLNETESRFCSEGEGEKEELGREKEELGRREKKELGRREREEPLGSFRIRVIGVELFQLLEDPRWNRWRMLNHLASSFSLYLSLSLLLSFSFSVSSSFSLDQDCNTVFLLKCYILRSVLLSFLSLFLFLSPFSLSPFPLSESFAGEASLPDSHFLPHSMARRPLPVFFSPLRILSFFFLSFSISLSPTLLLTELILLLFSLSSCGLWQGLWIVRGHYYC